MAIIKLWSRGDDVKLLQSLLNLQTDGVFGRLTDEAVRTFQKEHGLTADGIVGTETWAMLRALGGRKRFIDQIIVHYTATPEGEEFSNAQIRACHIARGFSDIGYHDVIGLNGEIRPGRTEAIAGAHCTNHNTRSIGVCYVGGCPSRAVRNWPNIGKDTRTPEQKTALIKLLKELKKRYPNATIHGHNEFANKPCPGFNAREEYKNI